MANKLEVAIVGDSSSFRRELSKSSSAASGFGSKLKSVGKFAALGIGIAGAAAGAAGVKMIGLASDAEEVESKFKIVFGRTMPKLTRQIDKFAAVTGASRFELRAQVADLGALIRPIVGNTREAGKMSVAVAKLATDLGSFNNVPVEEALLAIRSGLVGEAEPLRRFGVLLNEAAVNAEGLRLGLIKQDETMTEGEKVQARYSLIMKQTALAQGDAERTSGSFANQLKRLKNGVKDAGTTLGKFLLPVATAAIGAFNDAIPAIEGFLKKLGKADGFRAKFNVVWVGVSKAVSDLVDTIRDELFGEITRTPLKLKSGKIIEWQIDKQQGLVDAIHEGLATADWSRIGQTIGENISSKVKITADFIGNVLTAANAFIDKHIDEFAELGVKMALKMISKLLDPAFWKDNWQLILGIAIAVIPIGRFFQIGGKLGGAVVRGIASILPAGLRGVGSRAVTAILEVLGKLPGKAQGIIVRMVEGFIKTAKRIKTWLTGTLQPLLVTVVPGWIRKAFKISGVMAFINVIQNVIDKIKELIDWIKRIPDMPSFPNLPSLGDIGRGLLGRGGGSALGGVVRSGGLERVHTGETIVPARVSRGGAGMATATAGGPGRYLILADDQTVRFLQGLNTRHARGNGGRPIW